MQLLGFTLFSCLLLQQPACADGTGLLEKSSNCGWNSSTYLYGNDESATVKIVDKEFENNVYCVTQIEFHGDGYKSRQMQVEVDFFELNGSSATGSDCLLESERLTFELDSASGYFGSPSPKSVTWCGQLYAEKHIFSTKNLKIIYNSGQMGQGRGFKLKVSLVLVNSHNAIMLQATEQPRLLYSPGFPDSYGRDIMHSVTLEGEADHYILISILMIDLETDLWDECSDFLTIDNEMYCTTLLEPRDILVPHDSVQISFKSDFFSKENRGYILQYASYAVDNCGWNSSTYLYGNDESATVEIVDNKFGNNVYCVTQIEFHGDGYKSRQMQVEVDFFELNGSSATGSVCLLDSERLTFKLGNTSGYYDGSKSVTWCGQLCAEKHVFPTNSLKIIYNSGQMRQGRGFKLKVSPVLVNSHSAITLKATEQPRLLYSPGYPDSYRSYWRQSVSLEGETGHYILIRILMIDLETRASDRCHDSLTIDNEVYCKTLLEPRDILVPSDSVQISFKSDFSIENRGYILQYASYAVEHLNGSSAALDIGQVPKLYHVHNNSLDWSFSTADPNHTLHLNFIDMDEGELIFGYLVEPLYGVSCLDHDLKHYWSRSQIVALQINAVRQGFFILVGSVSGHGVGLFRAENTVAWLQSDEINLEGKRDFKIYVEKRSNLNIFVMISHSSREGITVHNGPDTSYFDMIKSCNPNSTARNRVISLKTNVVTVELSPENWRRGVYIQYYSTDKIQARDTVLMGPNKVIDKSFNQKLRNMFCFFTVPLTHNRYASLDVKTNLDTPNSLIVRSNGELVTNLQNSDITLQFSTVAVDIDLWIADPPMILSEEPEISLDLRYLDTLSDLDYHNLPLNASSLDEKEVSAPPYLILDPSIICSWEVIPVLPDSSSLMLIVYGATPVDRNLPHSENCAFLTLKSFDGGAVRTFSICPSAIGSQDVVYALHAVTVTLSRKVWVELPEPLFSYRLVEDSTKITPSNSLEKWCPHEVILGDGEEFVRTYGNFATCEMRILPRFYDSFFIVSIQNLGLIRDQTEDLTITITGFDPTDPSEKPLKVETIGLVRELKFEHMALKIDAQVPISSVSKSLFNINFRLHQESVCGRDWIDATDEPQYIVSPNYPQPFPGDLSCMWNIRGWGELHFELVEYDGSDYCKDDHLQITFDYSRFESETKICGKERNQVFVRQNYHQIQVEFHSEKNTKNHRGFLLRYSLKERERQYDYEGDLHSKSSSSGKTGVAVGSSIASILFLLMVGAALAVFITLRRKRTYQLHQRNRREFLCTRREQRSSDDDNSRSPSVFLVGSMVVNTNSPPPPYRARGSFDSANTNSGNYYTNPDGGYTNSAGQFTENRRNGQGNGGAPSENSELGPPPPYHPLMPGSPHSTDEHFSATLDSGTGDIGRSNNTLYPMAQITGLINGCGSEEGARQRSATPRSVSNQDEHRGRTRDTVEGSAQQQAPPPYEVLNPPGPPPTYEVVMLRVVSSQSSTV
ncbi:hypothetical protein RRG08_060266 [Elysia crispata]|uniref:CUB domain-containing protein n=1 Tax=Elysia crispata TaxID=231223 RepID=A0AAE1B8M5_9GAST|nr:hypothetical protein RRG08_060266 [Elysia crispata]